MQTELLAKYPKADLRVYAIWFNMFPGDARSKWPPSLLTDHRVIHRWDEGKIVGMWYGSHTTEIRAELSPGPRWTGQNRPFVDTSKPAISSERIEAE